MSFEERLEKGEFSVTYCHNCNVVIWPHSSFCNRCFSKTQLVRHTTCGTLLEYSSQNGILFCVCQLGDIHIMGRLLSQCKEGSPVRMSRCGMNDGVPFFEFVPQ